MAENRRKYIDASVIFRHDKEVVLLTKCELPRKKERHELWPPESAAACCCGHSRHLE